MEFNTTTVGGMLEDFIGNMPQEQIDGELKLFQHISYTLKGPGCGYAGLGVLVDEGCAVDERMLEGLGARMNYRPYLEKNKASGNVFLYFRNLGDAEQAAVYLTEAVEL